MHPVKIAFVVICILLVTALSYSQSIVGGRAVAFGAHAAALSWDAASIYYNPANVAGGTRMQIDAFAMDTAVSMPANWGVAVKKPSEASVGGSGMMLLQRSLVIDSIDVQSTQFAFAISDQQLGFPIGFAGKMIWEQKGKGAGWVYGGSFDVGFIIPLGGLRLGGAAINLFGMPTKTEYRHFEAGAAYAISEFIMSAGAGTQDLIGKNMLIQGKKTWGYGIEWQGMENASIRAGKFMEMGRQGETAGASYNTNEGGITVGYTIRRYSDDKNNLLHWVTYSFSPVSE